MDRDRLVGLLLLMPLVALILGLTVYPITQVISLSLYQQGLFTQVTEFVGAGNFDPPRSNELLRQVADALRPGDLFLLGADLIKPERDLILAYDDPLGVTAAFNRNLLVRINRELGADFDLASFRHRVRWNAEASRLEAYLVSTRPQKIRIPAASLELTMREGETIWTESSYKYTLDGVFGMLEAAGFRRRQAWVDEPAQFALTLVQR
jgi:uncharacterized SAM-dependent methyltransferase